MGSFGFHFLVILATLSSQITLNAAQIFLTNLCLGGNYTANSNFQANLRFLLSNISNSTVSGNSLFNNDTVGRSPDIVYGLFQCRGDILPEDCKNCVKKAAEGIMESCPYRKESIAFYQECSLQYSNKSFVTTVQFEPDYQLNNPANFGDPDLFSPKKNELMDRLVVQALASPNLFASGVENVTSSQKIYGLVQCTQDISRNDCDRCLRRAVSGITECCDKLLSVYSLKPSCNVRYENYLFFQPTPVAPPPASPLNRNYTREQEKTSSKSKVNIVVPIVTATVLIIVITVVFCLRRNRGIEIVNGADEITNAEFLQLDFITVAIATENFSEANRLGEGGFGVVYKGKLSDGQEIAVKRLSTNSGQGVEEFKNEVLLLAKLQHRNLVKLLGFCLAGVEKLLIYEFVPNSSLDHFLFDPVKCTDLNWDGRYKIIVGIARGLLYLHEDSQDTIIHRDLKASNVLLDSQMNPKISDFGMAKLVMVDQSQGITSRVVGTYGYMAPEYAMHGEFSVKSDVFSFGVLIIEIITGERNSNSYVSEISEDLLSHAWRHWEKGNARELLHPSLREEFSVDEVMRCVHMGLLCVQQDATKRPTMTSIVLMLSSYSVSLPLPSAPAYFPSTSTKNVNTISEGLETNSDDPSHMILENRSVSSSILLSVNDVSITELYPR